jgi:hypothetical protein
MSWKKAVFYPDHAIKIHYIHPDVAEVGLDDIKARHGAEPTSVEEISDLRIDPGGMLDMNSEPLVKEFDGLTVSVKPEHISGAIYRWNRTREVAPGVLKVYVSQYDCTLISEELHAKIGGWLVQNEMVGFAARKDIADRLNDHPNIYVHVPEPKAAGEA